MLIKEFTLVMCSKGIVNVSYCNRIFCPQRNIPLNIKRLTYLKACFTHQHSSTNSAYISDPDKFGTLSSKSLLRRRLEDLPVEEDDVTIQEFDDFDKNVRLSCTQFAKMIKSFLIKKKLNEALWVLENRMKIEKVTPDEYCYRLLISGCAKEGYSKKAFQLFNQMKKRALKIKGGVYTSLFVACGNSPWPQDGSTRAMSLWGSMKEKGIDINPETAHAAVKAFGRCGDIEKAFSVVDEMISQGLPITSGTMNFLLQACASDKDTGFRYALMVWYKMIDRKLMPSIYTYNLLLRCTRDCSVGTVDRFIEDSKPFLSDPHSKSMLELKDSEKTVKHNEKVYLISNLSTVQEKFNENKSEPKLLPQLLQQDEINTPWHRLKLLGGTEGFLNEMSKTKIKPDIKTFTQLLFIIAPNQQEEELLMDQMKQLGIKIDLDFCNMLIKKRNLYGNFPGAKEVLNIISQEQHSPNIVTFGVLAMGCTNLKNMKVLIKDMESLGFRLNIQILGAFLSSSCRTWNFEAIHFVVKLLLKNEIKPSYKFIKFLDNLNEDIKTNIEMKNIGKKYYNKLDNINFQEEHELFLELLKLVKQLEVEDPLQVHPWDQFKGSDKSCESDNWDSNSSLSNKVKQK